jgi:hypothetical protein
MLHCLTLEQSGLQVEPFQMHCKMLHCLTLEQSGLQVEPFQIHPNCTSTFSTSRDFELSPRRTWGVFSSGALRGVGL